MNSIQSNPIRIWNEKFESAHRLHSFFIMGADIILTFQYILAIKVYHSTFIHNYGAIVCKKSNHPNEMDPLRVHKYMIVSPFWNFENRKIIKVIKWGSIAGSKTLSDT